MQSLGWDGAVAAVQSGQADALIAGASVTPEQEASGWIFSDGYYTVTQTIAVATGSDITSREDLRGKNVAVKTAPQLQITPKASRQNTALPSASLTIPPLSTRTY